MNRRNRQRRIWSINMGGGTWAVCCLWCQKSLGRGSVRWARKAAATHLCR
jgi:hypothetical protein